MSETPLLRTVDLGRGTRRFQRNVTLGGAKPSGEAPRPRGVFDPELLRSAIPHAFRKLDPRTLIKNPVMFVVELTAVLVTLTAIANATGAQDDPGRFGPGLHHPDRRLALVHGPVRDLRRGRRRGPRPRPGGDPAQDAFRDHRPPSRPGRDAHRRRVVGAPQGRRHRRHRGRDDPGRRRRHRGRRLRQRGGDHGRIRAGPQGARDRHPQLGHRRHDPHQRHAS